MDAGTQTLPKTKRKDDKDAYFMDEFGIYELIESNGQTVKQYITRDEDTPVYPEPEGDPSY